MYAGTGCQALRSSYELFGVSRLSRAGELGLALSGSQEPRWVKLGRPGSDRFHPIKSKAFRHQKPVPASGAGFFFFEEVFGTATAISLGLTGCGKISRKLFSRGSQL